MEGWQPLNWTFNVSKAWSKAVRPAVLENLLKKALTNYRSDKKNAATKDGVSVLVVDEISGLLFIKMEEVNDEEIRVSDILLPMKASIVKLKRGTTEEKVQVNDLPVKLMRDHPFSDWFGLNSDNHKVVTAAPILEKIFKSKDITGEEVYHYAIETTYRTQKGVIPRKTFVQSAITDDSISLVKKVSDDQWEMTCFNRLVPPDGSWRHLSITYPWIAYGFRLSKDTETFAQNH